MNWFKHFCNSLRWIGQIATDLNHLKNITETVDCDGTWPFRRAAVFESVAPLIHKYLSHKNWCGLHFWKKVVNLSIYLLIALQNEVVENDPTLETVNLVMIQSSYFWKKPVRIDLYLTNRLRRDLLWFYHPSTNLSGKLCFLSVSSFFSNLFFPFPEMSYVFLKATVIIDFTV